MWKLFRAPKSRKVGISERADRERIENKAREVRRERTRAAYARQNY